MPLNFEAILMDAPVPMMVLDRQLHFVTANDAYLTMVSKAKADLIGRYVFDVFPEEPDRVEAMVEIFQKVFEGERPVFKEIPFTIARDGKLVEHWWTASHAPVPGADGSIKYLVQYSENVTEQVHLRELKDAMLGEMQHRIGNFFAVVGAIGRQVARSAADVPDFMDRFNSRLESFFTIQKQLMPGSEQRDGLQSVIDEQLKVYAASAHDRIVKSGPDVPLSPVEAQAVSMAVHELSTNSLKYGAIRNPDGKLDISWAVDSQDTVTLTWQETGVSGSDGPEQTGYGTMLLTTILPRQLHGVGTRHFDGDTFRYELTINRPD
jgi:PAS domain S-box-containing protein